MKTAEASPGDNLTELRQIPLGLLVESKTNPRTNFEPAALKDLEESISARGIEEPLIVRPLAAGGKFELVAGARRIRCARALKFGTVPCVVRKMTDAEVQLAQFTSFLHEGISDLEEARTYQRLLELQPGKTQEEKIEALGLMVGKKRSTILGRLSLLKLPEHTRAALEAGEINQSVAQLIGTVPDVKAQKALVGRAKGGESFRDLRDAVEREFRIDLKKAPFNPEGTLGCFGPCRECEHFSGNLAKRFPDMKLRPDVCTYGEGYEKKLRGHEEILRERYEREGLRVLTPAEVKKVFPYSHSESLYSKEYMDPTERCWQDPEGRSYDKLLGKLAPAAVIALRNGRAQRLWPKKAAERIMLAEKLIKKSSGSSYSEQEKERAAKQRIQTQVDLAVAREMVKQVEAGKAFSSATKQLAFMRLLAKEMLKQSCADGQRLIIQSRGWKDAKQHSVEHKANDLTGEQCLGVLCEILFMHGVRGGWGLEKSRSVALEILGVDAGAIAKRVKAELKAKKKPAKAKAAKPQPKTKGKRK